MQTYMSFRQKQDQGQKNDSAYFSQRFMVWPVAAHFAWYAHSDLMVLPDVARELIF